MAFSYTLFLALILLFPGLCAWAGLRAVERTDLLTPQPDKPNSTASLFVIVMGAIVGHLAGSFIFVLQGLWCRLAYVVTKSGHADASIAYEGIVQQLALDDDQVITMLVLGQVDRFLVRVTCNGVERIDGPPVAPIPQMQFHLSEIADVALEVLEDPDADAG